MSEHQNKLNPPGASQEEEVDNIAFQ